MNYQNNPSPTPVAPTAFERASELIRKACGGGLFLTVCILMSALTLLHFIMICTPFLSPDPVAAFSVSPLLPLAMIIMTTVGCWVVFAGAKCGREEFGAKMGLIKAYPIYLLVSYYIITVCVGLIGIVALATTDILHELLNSLGDVFGGSGIILDSLLTWGEGLFVFIALILLGACILTIIRYTKLIGMIGAIKEGLERKRVPHISPMFFCVLSFLGAFVFVIGGLMTLIIAPLTGLSTFLSAAIMTVVAILFLTLKSELEYLAEEEKKERAQAAEQKKRMMAAAAMDPRYMWQSNQVPPQYAPPQGQQPPPPTPPTEAPSEPQPSEEEPQGDQ